MSWKQFTTDRWKLTKYVDLRSKQNRTITSDELSVVIQRTRRLLVVYNGNHVLEQIPLHHPQPIVVFRDCAIHITLILPTQQEIKFRIRLASVTERSDLCGVLSEYITVHDYYATHSGQSQSSLLSNESNESQIMFSQTLNRSSLSSPYYDSPRGSQQTLDQRQRCSQMRGSQDLFVRNSQETAQQLSQCYYSNPSVYQTQGLSQSYSQDVLTNYSNRSDLLPSCASNRPISTEITPGESIQKVDQETQTDQYDLSQDKLCFLIDSLLQQPEFRTLVNVIKDVIPSTTAGVKEVPYTLTSIGLNSTPCKPDQDLSFLSNDSTSLYGVSANRYVPALERNLLDPQI